MRIFTGLCIDTPYRDALYASYLPVRRELGSVKWVAAENLHITLIFFGEMTPAEVEQLTNLLSTGTALPSEFTVRYQGIECFPPKGKPKVIYSGISSGGDRCIEVWKEIVNKTESLGRFDPKPYIPHITLGRIKTKGYYPRPGPYDEIAGQFPVTSVGVFESELTPEGPVYRMLQSYSLGSKSV